MNCQSVRAKLANFQYLLQEEDPDIVIGTESWLHTNITSGEIFPSNFNIFRKDRDISGDSHGGVFVAAKNILVAQEEPDLDQQGCGAKMDQHSCKRHCPGVYCRLLSISENKL